MENYYQKLRQDAEDVISTIKDYEEKIDNLREEFRIVDEACGFWKDEANTLSKRVSHVQGKLEELKDESDMLANENRNMAEYLARELDHSQENIDTIAHGFWTYRKEEPTGELVHCLNCDNVFEEVKLDGGCRACGESVEGTAYLDPSSELYKDFKNNIKGEK